MTYDLFISHSSEDAETALALVADFENRNITCWVAPRDIPMGSSYHEEIVQAIENSRAVLLLFSGAANKSAHVLREVELAEQGRKPILPLRIDVSDPAGGLKYMLANKQWVERKALGNRLVDTIEQLLAGSRPIRTGVDEARARPAPQPPKKKGGLSPMLIGIVAAVLLLLVGGGIAAWQMNETQRIAQAEQLRKEQERREAGLREQERLKKEREEQEKRAAEAAKQEEERTRQQAAKDEEERKRVASIRPVTLPVAPTREITIEKSAPAVGDAVPGKTFFRECDICPVMAVVPAGSNLIGSPSDESGRSNNEGPQQPVAFRVPFAVGRSEVSFEEYIACINEGGCPPGLPSDYGWGYGKQPAMQVSWNHAKAYVGWLSRKTGGKYRLLSEAEWEYAARGCARVCDSTPFWFGTDISKARANYDTRIAYLGSPKADRRGSTLPIDASEPNPFGLLHVHGNVAEWVEDCWQENLVGLPPDGTARTDGDCLRRVVRGGSWSDDPKALRSAARSWQVPEERRAQIGFRVARELKL
ncbi:MAG: SUMF1/EgtB/PvdO family nonheme iron enzyme [Xanthobacteraceae bacterium]